MTLSGWLKSYLYISLGGNRVSSVITYRNLVVTMLLGGLWHGASWTFVLWGGLHGALLAAERFLADRVSFRPPLLIRRFIVFAAVTSLWIFFRSPDISVAWEIISGIVFLQEGSSASFTVFALVLLVVVLAHAAGLGLGERTGRILAEDKKSPVVVFAVLIIVAVFLSADARPFIYFVF